MPEILKVVSILDSFYEATKAFYLRPRGEKASRALRPPERFQFREDADPNDIIGFCKAGYIVLADLPKSAKYRANRNFEFKLNKELVNVARWEICEIQDHIAWRLLLENKISPIDTSAWSPDRLAKKPKMAHDEKEAHLDDLSRLVSGCKPRIGLDWKVRK